MKKNLPRPGSKIKSQGTGRGLGTGEGKGPLNINMRRNNKNPSRSYMIRQYDEDELYDFGGWLKNNAGSLLTTVAGGVLTATGIGGEIGIPLMVSGGAGLLGGIGGDSNETVAQKQDIILPRKVGIENNTPNVMSFENGGELYRFIPDEEYKKGGKWIQKATKSIKERGTEGVCSGSKFGSSSCPPGSRRYNLAKTFRSMAAKSKKKEGGGMLDTDNEELIELEGNTHEEGGIKYIPGVEVEGGETIYGNVVNSDSIKITKNIAKKYNLPKISIGKTVADYSKTISDNAIGEEGNPFVKNTRTMQLNNIARMSADIAKEKNEKFQLGGSFENPYKLPGINVSASKSPFTNTPNAMSGITKMPGLQRTNNPFAIINKDYFDAIKGDSKKGDSNGINIGDLGSDLLGLAPIAMNAFNIARAKREKPEEVKIGRIEGTEYNPSLIDPRYGLSAIGDTYATQNEAMKQISTKDYLRRGIQSAAEESKSKSAYLGDVKTANTSMINQARMMNEQSKQQANMFNIEASLQEENINAANQAAYLSNLNIQRNNLATMIGEYGRDIQLRKANEEYNSLFLDTIKDMFSGLTYDPNTRKWIPTGQGIASDNTSD